MNNMSISIFGEFTVTNIVHKIHYFGIPQHSMNYESEKDKGKEYNLQGIQVHRSCSRFLLNSPNKFDTSHIEDVPIQKLFVTNLAKKTTQEDLSKLFLNFGKVEECVIKKNKKSNYAFITLANVEDALKALNFTSRLHEKELTVVPADSRHQPTYIKKDKKVVSEPNENSEEPSSSSSSKEVYPLVHRISDNCLMNIFQYLPIVDRVRVERVCRRWRDLSLDSWRTLRRLDVDSSSWGCKSVELGTSDLYQVLKRCGRFITMITFFENNRMMSLRTLFIIGKLCPHLKIAYLGTLEVTPREIFFLLSQCPNLEFLELDSFHFSDRDFIEIFSKSKKLKYVSFEESRIDGSCFISLPEETETLVFHEPTRGVNHIIFHSAIKRLKNLQNLYLSVSHNDDFVANEMGIPVFDDRDANDIDIDRDFDDNEYDDDDDDDDGDIEQDIEVDDYLVDDDNYDIHRDTDNNDYDYNHGIARDVDDNDFDVDNQEMDVNEEDYDENSIDEDGKVFQDILMMINETEGDNVGNNSHEENVGWGPKPQSSAKKDEDPNLENQCEKNEDSSAKKEYVRWSPLLNSYEDKFNKHNNKFNEQKDSDEEFESEEDFNDISSTPADVPEQKDNKLASFDTSNTKTSDTKISDAETSESKISDAKTSDAYDNTKSSNDRKEETLESINAKDRIYYTCSESSDDFSRNHELDSNSSGSFKEAKVGKRDEQKDKESDSNAEVDTKKEELKTNEEKKMPTFDDFDCGGLEDPYVVYVDNDEVDSMDYPDMIDYEDFFNDCYDYADYDYDDSDDDDDDGFDVENDFNYESNLANTIKETIKNCNKNLKILQLKRCNPTDLTSEDLITNFTNFTSLERLDISKMKIVNDDLLSAIGANCPKLSVLIINACDSVTDTGIGGIALLPELKHLSMSDIPQVSGKPLETVSSLKTLYCARCDALQEEGLTQLILNSHELEQLDIQMCKFISNSIFDTALVAIQNRTNSIKLKIFARGSSIDVSKIEAKSEHVEILMERRFEELDSFVDGDLGTEKTGLGGDCRFRDFRGIIFESSTTEKDKED